VTTQLPDDSSGLTFIDVMPPEPVIDRRTKQQTAAATRSRCPPRTQKLAVKPGSGALLP